MADKDLKDIVKAKYGQAALRVTSGGNACCGSAPSRGECDPITSNLYDAGETAGLPPQAGPAPPRCGKPPAPPPPPPRGTLPGPGPGGGGAAPPSPPRGGAPGE